MEARDLIFRAKRLVDNRWITGTLVNVGAYVGISEHRSCYEEVDASTLCLWCGRTDVKGLMVFDKDHVKASTVKGGKVFLWRVEWSNDGFVAVLEDDGSDADEVVPVGSLFGIKVVGNTIDDEP